MQMDESVVYRVRLVLPSAAATTTVTSEVATSTEHTMMSTTAGTTSINYDHLA